MGRKGKRNPKYLKRKVIGDHYVFKVHFSIIHGIPYKSLSVSVIILVRLVFCKPYSTSSSQLIYKYKPLEQSSKHHTFLLAVALFTIFLFCSLIWTGFLCNRESTFFIQLPRNPMIRTRSLKTVASAKLCCNCYHKVDNLAIENSPVNMIFIILCRRKMGGLNIEQHFGFRFTVNIS